MTRIRTTTGTALEIPVGTYHSYERGIRPSFALLHKFITATQCNSTWLLTGLGDIDDPENARAADAVREAVDKYGPEASMEQIKDETLAILMRKLDIQEENNKRLREKNDDLSCALGLLQEKVKRLEKRLAE